MNNLIKAFSKGVAHSRISMIGAMIALVSFPFLLALILIDLWVHIDNPYFGAAIYMIMGPVFTIGLVLMFVGLFFFQGKEEVRLFTLSYLREQFTDDVRFARVRRLIFVGILLAGFMTVLLAVFGYSGYHYMESNSFCGEFCHTVMTPEYTAYMNSPHSRVKCVKCHIGSGATWFAKSKISGARQLFAVAFNTYSRPIETPVHGLRPARDTCEQCHLPDKFHGDKLRVIDGYDDDAANTPLKTVMLMKIGSAGDRSKAPHGIHWHVAEENRITYKADSERLIIPEVVLTRADGSAVVYRSESAAEEAHGEELESRVMDCIDCHNRPTHIYRSAEEAIDIELEKGSIDRAIPFIKERGLEAVQAEYSSREEAVREIGHDIRAWYTANAPEVDDDPLAFSIEGITRAYLNNVFPEMNVRWDTYTNHIGHGPDFDRGCFRCHDGDHLDESGEEISSDCSTCHIILAEEEENPEILELLQGE